mgnify:CR=1 FL=1
MTHEKSVDYNIKPLLSPLTSRDTKTTPCKSSTASNNRRNASVYISISAEKYKKSADNIADELFDVLFDDAYYGFISIHAFLRQA